jgi:hypothetical protein
MDLANASAIVTGGAGGYGSATVRRLAQKGAKVVIADVSDERGEALAREVGASRTATIEGWDLHRQALRHQSPKTRALEPGKAPGKRPKMDEPVRKLLEEDLKERPFVTLQERCDYVEAISGVSVSRSTMCRAIARIGSTRKKGAEKRHRARRVPKVRLAGYGGRRGRPRVACVRG